MAVCIMTCHPRDQCVLEDAIAGAKQNLIGVTKVYVISETRLSDNAEWLPESAFPFTLDDVKAVIGDRERAPWYLQQLLKFYAMKVLDVQKAVIMCCDTTFLRPVNFFDPNDDEKIYFNHGWEHHIPYFEHYRRLIPTMKRTVDLSGICHCIPATRYIMDHIHKTVERIHGVPFWKAMLQCVDPKHYDGSGMADYELIFHYTLCFLPECAEIRLLQWKNAGVLVDSDRENFDYVSRHWYLRPENQVPPPPPPPPAPVKEQSLKISWLATN